MYLNFNQTKMEIQKLIKIETQKSIKMDTQKSIKMRTQKSTPKIGEIHKFEIKTETQQKSIKMETQNTPQKSEFWGPKAPPKIWLSSPWRTATGRRTAPWT